MKRRTLIHALGAGAGLVAVLPACRPTLDQTRHWQALARPLTGLEQSEIDAVTRAALEVHTASDWRGLLPEIQGLEWQVRGAASGLDDVQLGAALQTVARDQYRQNQVHVMAGWVLSELECAICALR